MSATNSEAVTRDKRLLGRTAIVTGAGAGIGQGITLALAKEGANLVIVGRTLETLQETAKMVEAVGGNIRCVQGSVADRETAARSADEAIKAFGRLDVLVNNAHTLSGRDDYVDLDQTPEENFRTHMESGFFGTLHFMQAAFPHMKERGGSIINTGSIGALEAWATLSPYSAAKEAIRVLSRTASRDWGKYQIRVNVIAPAARTWITDQYMSDPDFAKATLARKSLGYMGEPEADVAPVIVFLACDDSRYVTGETIKADGGM